MSQTLRALIDASRDRNLHFNPQQQALTERHLLPRLGELRELISRLREETDVWHWTEGLAALSAKGVDVSSPVSPLGYPAGCCEWIRDLVEARLRRHPQILEWMSSGLVLKKVYVILEGRWFQNGLQFGNLFLDPANDSVEAGRPAVDARPLKEVLFENLESWQRYAEVSTLYHGAKLFPNLYFPLLFPLAPFLALKPSGQLTLLHTQEILFLKDLNEDFRRLKTCFRPGSPWLERSLPPFWGQRLETAFGENRREKFPFEFNPMTAGEMLQNILPDFERALGCPVLEQGILTLLRLARTSTRQFREVLPPEVAAGVNSAATGPAPSGRAVPRPGS